ncbi:MAG: serpin family protein [Chloroflexi bacterium]|nr:serpin family protein [Chloroflexota bacterium]
MVRLATQGKTLLLLAGVALLSLALAACGGSAPSLGDIAEARSDAERIAEPNVPAGDLDALVGGNTDFAFALYQVLRADASNLVYSPHSISVALAMTYAGARGETEREMAQVLSFLLAQERLHPAFNALDLALNAPPAIGIGGGDPLELSIANSLWGQQGFEFLAPFLDTLAQHYGAGMRLVDYRSDPEAARQLINAWVAEQTNDRIPELFQPGIIDDLTRLVLTNAVFFKASWLFPFDPADTAPGDFHLLDGGTVQAEMMRLNERTNYGEAGGAQTVRLPYSGLNYSAYVIMPDEGEFAAFEERLDADALDAIIGGLGDAQVTLTMPKFEFDSSFGLKETLKALGMTSAFDPGFADFSGMSDVADDLYIQDLVHKAFIAVDEEGTEAAAATGVVGGDLSSPPPAVMNVDRAFLFVVRHERTGAILFVARVLDPTA